MKDALLGFKPGLQTADKEPFPIMIPDAAMHWDSIGTPKSSIAPMFFVGAIALVAGLAFVGNLANHYDVANNRILKNQPQVTVAIQL